MSMSMNLMVLPQVCLIIRNFEEWTGKTHLDLWYVTIVGVTGALIIRYAIKTLFLRKALKMLKRTQLQSK
jgi:hypothetical protein